jgi:hypothetical protein
VSKEAIVSIAAIADLSEALAELDFALTCGMGSRFII